MRDKDMETILGWGRMYEDVYGNAVQSIQTNRGGVWRYSPFFTNDPTLTLTLQGRRSWDFREANIQAGISRSSWPPFGYTWHHVYNPNFNPWTALYLMQLVNSWLHVRTCAHVGAFKQGQEAGLYTPAFAEEHSFAEMKRQNERITLPERIYETATKEEKRNMLEDIQKDFYPAYQIPTSIYQFFYTYVNDAFRPKLITAKIGEQYSVATLFPLSGEESLYELIRYERTEGREIRGTLAFASEAHLPFAGDGLGNIYFVDLKQSSNVDAEVYFYNHELNQTTCVCSGVEYFIGSWSELLW